MMTDVDIAYIFQSIGLTILFVGMIGFERQRKHKIAGLSTHILVAMGALTLTLVQVSINETTLEFVSRNPDYVEAVVVNHRITAQIVAGVGFLGTGAIIKQRGNVSGLTTASTLWVSAIIGIVFGYGEFLLGIIVSIMTIISLTVIKRLFRPYYEEEDQDNE